jgi:hypothetical protein
MQALIDSDQRAEAAAAAVASDDVSFRGWLNGWVRHHRGAAAVAASAASILLAAFTALTLLALRPAGAPAMPAVAGPVHELSISVTDGADVVKAVVYRDGAGDLVLRGEPAAALVTSTPTALKNVAALSVTVSGQHVSCAITVDGVIADQAEGDGLVTCVWSAAKSSSVYR